jgi:GTP-binding protein
MAIVDEAKIHVAAGAGGNGASAFHREPFKPKGGPDGGDGGAGGSVILRADPGVGTLLELRDYPHVKAERGGHGEGSRRSGSRGKDRIVLVPAGTVVYDDQGTLVADLANAGDELVAAQGGRGGRGNARFATATRRTPAFAEKGEPGEEGWLKLELRLLADVGLVGFPNAGKSTLISRISAAKPKIADYPFTTLEPNLGVVKGGEGSFVVADIPGLVPGAHEGKGLGIRFLKHISRAAVMVYFIDPTAFDRDPSKDLPALKAELEAFDPELATRPALVVVSKVDVGGETLADVVKSHPDAIRLSSVSGEGIDEVVGRLGELVAAVRSSQPERAGYVRHITRPDSVTVTREGSTWRVTGRAPERAVGMTDFNNDEALRRLQKRLIAMGVERALYDAGARAGDDVAIGDETFEFKPEEQPTGA